MPKLSAARAEARRLQILDAATRCFARKGLHRTTMQDICRLARLSPGSVYSWFPSKHAIVAEMTRRRLRRDVTAQRDATHDPRGAIRSYLDSIRQAAENTVLGWMNMHLVSESASDKQLRSAMQTVTHAGVVTLEKALRRMLRRRGAPSAAARARLLQAAAFGIVLQSLLSPNDAASFALAEQLIVER